MQVIHTPGVPPKNGRISLPTSGWTRNSSKALVNSVTVKSSSAGVSAIRLLMTPSPGGTSDGRLISDVEVEGDVTSVSPQEKWQHHIRRRHGPPHSAIAVFR